MTTKICSLCKKRKRTTEFNKNSWKKDGLQTACRECNKKKAKAYYASHTKEHRKNVLKRGREVRKRNAQFIFDYLLTHPCIDCGNNNPIVLEFDHIKGKKLKAVTSLAWDATSIKTIQVEIDKCEVRCANCHRIKTAKERGSFRFNMEP